MVRYGIGRHAITLSADDAVAIGKVIAMTKDSTLLSGFIAEHCQLIFSLQITYSVLITVTKASILMLYRRIFTLNLKAFRICWWISVSLVLAYFVAIIIIACTQCTPISRLWSLTAPCQTSFVPAAIFGSINALTDLIILTLPLPMVWGLHLPRKQKIAVSATFLLGVLCVIAISSLLNFSVIWTNNLTSESSSSVLFACLTWKGVVQTFLVKPLFLKLNLHTVKADFVIFSRESRHCTDLDHHRTRHGHHLCLPPSSSTPFHPRCQSKESPSSKFLSTIRAREQVQQRPI